MRGKGGLPTVPVVRERAMVDGGDRACEETQTRSTGILADENVALEHTV